MNILEAGQKDMPLVRELFLEYQEWLGVDLCFQGFEQELANLPGCYAPPRGAIYLAMENNEVVGCIGIRPEKVDVKTGNVAELKRLYVSADNQGKGIGKQLLHAAMSKAKLAGYAAVVLDTLPMMEKARSLYESYGFKEIPAYYNNPEQGVKYYRYEFS